MKKNIRSAFPFLIAAAAVVIVSPLRVLEYFKYIEPETGFYTDKSSPVIWIVYALLILAGGYSLFYFIVNRKKVIPTPISYKSLPFAAVSVVTALGVGADSVVQLTNYFNLFSVQLTAGQSIKQYISMQGGSILLILSVTGFLSAVYFLVSGIAVGLGNLSTSKLRLPALFPVIWCIFRLLYRFKRTISFTNVSDLLLELFLIAFSMMFFFACAQVNSKIDSVNDEKSIVRNEFWKVSGYGIPTFILAAVCFIPRLIVTVAGKGGLLPSFYPVSFADLAVLLFSAYTTVSAMKADSGPEEGSGD